MRGIELLNSCLGWDIRQHPLSSEYETGAKVAQAFQKRTTVVIGGLISEKIAKEAVYPFVSGESGEEGNIQIVQEDGGGGGYARNLEKTRPARF